MHSSSHAPILSSTRIRVLPCAAVEVPTTSSGGKAMAGGGGMAEEAESKEPLRSVLTRVLEKASWREVDGIWSPPSPCRAWLRARRRPNVARRRPTDQVASYRPGGVLATRWRPIVARRCPGNGPKPLSPTAAAT